MNEPSQRDLIAPCGMNCAVCSKYLSYLNGLKRSQCPGCRPGNKHCSYLFGKCAGLNADRIGNAGAPFCYQCSLYPCKEIDRMDARYRQFYRMSVKENLAFLQNNGLQALVRIQTDKYQCGRCIGMISTHNGQCFHCEEITALIRKDTR